MNFELNQKYQIFTFICSFHFFYIYFLIIQGIFLEIVLLVHFKMLYWIQTNIIPKICFNTLTNPIAKKII